MTQADPLLQSGSTNWPLLHGGRQGSSCSISEAGHLGTHLLPNAVRAAPAP